MELRLHPEVTATLKLSIESTTPVFTSETVAAPTKDAEGREHARTESRGHKRAEKVREEVATQETPEKGNRPERKPRVKTEKPAKAAKAEKAE